MVQTKSAANINYVDLTADDDDLQPSASTFSPQKWLLEDRLATLKSSSQSPSKFKKLRDHSEVKPPGAGWSQEDTRTKGESGPRIPPYLQRAVKPPSRKDIVTIPTRQPNISEDPTISPQTSLNLDRGRVVLSDSDSSRVEKGTHDNTPSTTPEEPELNPKESPVRKLRAAAVDATRSITGFYQVLNPLEERFQAAFTSPRKPGRPRKDEWTPPKNHGSKHRRVSSKSQRPVERKALTNDIPSASADPTSSQIKQTPLQRAEPISVIPRKRKNSDSADPVLLATPLTGDRVQTHQNGTTTETELTQLGPVKSLELSSGQDLSQSSLNRDRASQIQTAGRPKEDSLIASISTAGNFRQNLSRSLWIGMVGRTNPPSRPIPGSKDAPWLRLTDSELTDVQRRMHQSSKYRPSRKAIISELAKLGRGPANYLSQKAEAEAKGTRLLDDDRIATRRAGKHLNLGEIILGDEGTPSLDSDWGNRAPAPRESNKSTPGSSAMFATGLLGSSGLQPSPVSSTEPLFPDVASGVDQQFSSLVPDQQLTSFSKVPSDNNLAHESQISSLREGNPVLYEVFETIVYPAIRKCRKDFRGSLSVKDLDQIDKDISVAIVKTELARFVNSTMRNVDKYDRQQVEAYVTDDYRRKILQCLHRRPVQGEAKSSNDMPGTRRQLLVGTGTHGKTITDFQSCLRGLEDQALQGDTELFEDARHSLLSPEPEKDIETSLSLPDSSPRLTPTGYAHLDTEPASTLPPIANGVDSEFSRNTSFPPGFDRGRFPAQRRKRANKYYTPAKPLMTVKTTVSTFNNIICQDSMESHSPSETLKAATNPVFQELVNKAKSDPSLRELLNVVAAGKATPTQNETYLALFNHAVISLSSPRRTSSSGVDDTAAADSRTSRFKVGSRHDRRVRHNNSSPYVYDFSEEFNEIDGIPANDSVRPTQMGAHGAPHPLKARVVSPEERNVTPTHQYLKTAHDPYLEYMTATLVINDELTPRARVEEASHTIMELDQQQVLEDRTILLHADPLQKGMVKSKRNVVRLETNIVDPAQRPQKSTASLIRNRELGLGRSAHHSQTLNRLRCRNTEKIEPWRFWKGASGDIVATSWASNSSFAAGAAAHINEEDLQYNRPCNLMLGDLVQNCLTELPDHRLRRPRPETISSGPNSTRAVYEACDPMVYQTVTSIAFSPAGDQMYTASYDQTVKIWDVSTKRCTATLPHDALVTSIDVSSQTPGLFASGSECLENAIRIYYCDSSLDDLQHFDITSIRASQKRRTRLIFPECLRWGPTPGTGHLLMAGFQQSSNEGYGNFKEGDLVLWDVQASESIRVSPSSQSIYAATWHPTLPLFATGGASGGTVTDKYTTKSVVRTWDKRMPQSSAMEYECSALDMQDITFSPADSNIVTAGCTDGTSFVWDFRRPERPLHRLRHGRPLIDWDHNKDREEADSGVMMSLWGLDGNLFYSGSSDGVIKAWDVRRHPADVLIRDVARFSSGIQSGAFSPDGTNLLVGDADGGVHVLSSAPCGPRMDIYDRESNCKEEPIKLIRAPDGSGRRLNHDEDNPGVEGIEAAKKLVASGRVICHRRLGPIQGANYDGPYATNSREQGPFLNGRGALKPEIEVNQPVVSSTGEKRLDVIKSRRAFLKARQARILTAQQRRHWEESGGTAGLYVSALGGNLAQPADIPSPETKHPAALVRTFLPSRESSLAARSEIASSSSRASASTPSVSLRTSNLDVLYAIEDDVTAESEMVEEDFWWDRLGEDEIMSAREGRPIIYADDY